MLSSMKAPVAKDFYSVTQLANDLGVTARTIRFYETKELIAPQRAGNNRVYTTRDRARMILILRGKMLGFTLREIKEYLDLYDADPIHAKQVRLLLKRVRTRLLRLEQQQIALKQALSELRVVETQAQTALETFDTSTIELPPKLIPRTGAGAGSDVTGAPS